MTTPTLDQMIACLRREIALRKNVYPKWVANGRMTQVKADEEIAAMQAVHDLVEAAKQPTENMLMAGADKVPAPVVVCDDVEKIWNAMVREALR